MLIKWRGVQMEDEDRSQMQSNIIPFYPILILRSRCFFNIEILLKLEPFVDGSLLFAVRMCKVPGFYLGRACFTPQIFLIVGMKPFWAVWVMKMKVTEALHVYDKPTCNPGLHAGSFSLFKQQKYGLHVHWFFKLICEIHYSKLWRLGLHIYIYKCR